MKKVPNDIFHQMKKQALGNRQHLCNLLLLDLKGMSVFAGVFTEHQSSSVWGLMWDLDETSNYPALDIAIVSLNIVRYWFGILLQWARAPLNIPPPPPLCFSGSAAPLWSANNKWESSKELWAFFFVANYKLRCFPFTKKRTNLVDSMYQKNRIQNHAKQSDLVIIQQHVIDWDVIGVCVRENDSEPLFSTLHFRSLYFPSPGLCTK